MATEGQVPATTPAQDATTTTPAPETFDADYVRTLRQEAAGHRTKAKQLEDELGKLKAAQMTDAEKQAQALVDATKRAEAAEAAVRDTRLRLEVERQARALNLVDEDVAYRLIDRDAVKYDGETSNVGELLAALVKAKTWLAKPAETAPPVTPDPAAPPQVTTPAVVPTPSTSPMNPPQAPHALTRDAIRKMTPEQINANWEQVQAAMTRA